MTMPRDEGQPIPLPSLVAPATPPVSPPETYRSPDEQDTGEEVAEEATPEEALLDSGEEEDDLADLFDVPDEDIDGQGDEEDDMSDLFDVPDEDIVGKSPSRRYKITKRGHFHSGSPPPSLGGIQY